MLHALALRSEATPAIEAIHGAVEGLVGAGEIWRHEIGVVEIGRRCFGMRGAGVQDGLGEWFQFREVALSRRQRISVVDEADRIAVVALEPPADIAQPRHVHG